MKSAFFISSLLHGSLLAGVVIGLPQAQRPLPMLQIYIPIDTMNYDEFDAIIERAPQEAMEAQTPLLPEVRVPSPLPLPPEVPQMVDIIPPLPPELSLDIAVPRVPDMITVPDLVVDDEPPVEPEPIIESEPEPPSEPDLIAALDRSPMAPLPSRRPRRELEPEVEITQERNQEEMFAAIMGNLQESQDASTAPDTDNPEATPVPDNQHVRIASAVSRRERSAVIQQISRNWNYNAYGANMQERVVHLSALVNRDRTVAEVMILNSDDEMNDEAFSALVRSAVRAIYKSEPLDLPEDKYDEWHELILSFSPQDML